MLKHVARGGYHGSIPWPGRGRSQRTRDPIGGGAQATKLPASSPRSVGMSTRRNGRLGDSSQMIIKRQEESLRFSLCAASDD